MCPSQHMSTDSTHSSQRRFASSYLRSRSSTSEILKTAPVKTRLYSQSDATLHVFFVYQKWMSCMTR